MLRLDASGHLDLGFGNGGTVQLPVSGASGLAARLLPDGRVVTVADATIAIVGGGYAVRLLADGSVDPTYNSGRPAPIPYAQDLTVRADGRLDVLQAIVAPKVLVRLTADGQRDATFASGGTAAVDSSLVFAHLVARDNGGDLVWAGNPQPGVGAVRDVALQDVTAGGGTQPLREASIPFAAGGVSYATVESSAVPHGFQAGALIARADGGLLVLGGAPVRKYTGEGEGFSTVPLAEALLRPDDSLDPTFGGPLATATASVSLVPRRAVTAARTRYLRVRFRGSGPGTAILRVRDAHGHILAEDVTAVVDRTSTTALVALTPEGRHRVTGRRPLRVVVGVRFRDVTGALVGAVAPGALR